MNNLTGLELDVLRLIIEGYTNKQIAEKILYSPSLINKKVSELLKKFKVSNRTQLAIMFKNYDKINT
jgi:DNA-binding NarL/FixJ family response regulator